MVPTVTVPFIATQRIHASVPSMTFANLTQVLSNNTVWEARIGRFIVNQDTDPSSGDWETASRRDSVTGVVSENTPQVGAVRFDRITAKALLNRYQQQWLGADHHFRVGTHSNVASIGQRRHLPEASIPSSITAHAVPDHHARSLDSGRPLQHGALFASDSISLTDRITAEAGVRFDHSQAISQDLVGVDDHGKATDGFTAGLGTLYTWNVLSPRLGMTAKLDANGRTVLRANYGRFNQGVLTGELEPIHPGVSSVRTIQYVPRPAPPLDSTVDPNRNLDLDRHTRTPHTDEYSFAVDRLITTGLTASAAYIAKRGRDFIGWKDTGGVYTDKTVGLPDGTDLAVKELTNTPGERLFYLTNPATCSSNTTDSSSHWRSGCRRAGRPPARTRSPGRTGCRSRAMPPRPKGSSARSPGRRSLTFGQDPNDLTNATGRLPNDRPHVFRTTGSSIFRGWASPSPPTCSTSPASRGRRLRRCGWLRAGTSGS